MNIQTKDIKNLNLEDFTFPNPIMSLDKEKAQMRDQIEMLEREVERQETIIDALVKAIKVIERG